MGVEVMRRTTSDGGRLALFKDESERSEVRKGWVTINGHHFIIGDDPQGPSAEAKRQAAWHTHDGYDAPKLAQNKEEADRVAQELRKAAEIWQPGIEAGLRKAEIKNMIKMGLLGPGLGPLLTKPAELSWKQYYGILAGTVGGAALGGFGAGAAGSLIGETTAGYSAAHEAAVLAALGGVAGGAGAYAMIDGQKVYSGLPASDQSIVVYGKDGYWVYHASKQGQNEPGVYFPLVSSAPEKKPEKKPVKKWVEKYNPNHGAERSDAMFDEREMTAREWLEKFNQNHGPDGRFTSGDGGGQGGQGENKMTEREPSLLTSRRSG